MKQHERRQIMDNGASSYRRFLDGDDNGFVEIVKLYKNSLIFFLNGYVNNIHQAEDLAEETFFKLLVKKPHYNGSVSFKTWLFTIGRNIAFNTLRRKSILRLVPMDDCEPFLQEAEDFEKSFLIEEQKIELKRALDKLNPKYREALRLIFFEELSADEAAVVLRKSKRQIANLVYRAKQALKTELEKEGFVYENL